MSNRKTEIKKMKIIEKIGLETGVGSTFCERIKNEHWNDLVRADQKTKKKLFFNGGSTGIGADGYVTEKREVCYTVEGYHAVHGWDDYAQRYWDEYLETAEIEIKELEKRKMAETVAAKAIELNAKETWIKLSPTTTISGGRDLIYVDFKLENGKWSRELVGRMSPEDYCPDILCDEVNKLGVKAEIDF